jgi:hypothetical protein
MSQAIQRAVDRLNFAAIRDRRVFLDPTYITGNIPITTPGKSGGPSYVSTSPQPSPEQTYMLGELRARLLSAGIRLTDKRDAAQVIIELRTPGIGIDRTDFLLGIPAFSLPSFAGFSTPEVAIVKIVKQRGFAGAAIVAYWADTGEWIASSGPETGKTNREDFWFFGWGPRTVGDIIPAEQQR